MRTVSHLARVRPGYDTANILAMAVTSVQRDQWKDFHTRGLERVSALPGVRQAAFVWGLPLTGNKWGGEMEIVGQPGSSKPKHGAEASGLMDWWMNGLRVSTSIDPIIQQSDHPFIR